MSRTRIAKATAVLAFALAAILPAALHCAVPHGSAVAAVAASATADGPADMIWGR